MSDRLTEQQKAQHLECMKAPIQRSAGWKPTDVSKNYESMCPDSMNDFVPALRERTGNVVGIFETRDRRGQFPVPNDSEEREEKAG